MKFAALLLLVFGVIFTAVFARHHHHKHTHHHRRPVEEHELGTEIIQLHSALPDPGKGVVWAVLVAGSNGWWNYRHQADIGHAYHTLKSHGIDAKHIITLMYDDVAHNKQNPYPGKLFNRPHGEDVYEGLEIDYRGKDVTPENFIAILKGDKTSVKGGNGRVLKSNSNDRIFVYFTDHGATGLVSFPEGILTVKTLNNALEDMHKKKRYSQLVFYLEACESGSMFENVLKRDIDVYAVSAANGHESSWGTFCENDMRLPCLGDLFSVNWMMDSDVEDLTTETLEYQFEIVRNKTDKSHVMHFGDLEITKEPVAFFQGNRKTHLNDYRKNDLKEALAGAVSWPSRDVELMSLMMKRDNTNDLTEQKATTRQIADIYATRKSIKTVYHSIVDSLFDSDVDKRLMFEDRKLLSQLECHHNVVHIFDKVCVDVNKFDYALKYIYVLANLCEEIKNTDIIVSAMMNVCPDAFFNGN